MLVKDRESTGHQLVVVRDVTRRQLELLNPGLLRERDPDLRYKHALEVQCDNGLLLHVSNPPPPTGTAWTVVCATAGSIKPNLAWPSRVPRNFALESSVGCG